MMWGIGFCETPDLWLGRCGAPIYFEARYYGIGTMPRYVGPLCDAQGWADYLFMFVGDRCSEVR